VHDVMHATSLINTVEKHELKCCMQYLLLIPPILLFGLWVASKIGMVAYPVDTGSALTGSAYWVVMFLISHGSGRGWPGVRALIVAFVIFNFAAVFYAQIRGSVSLGSLGLNLMGAAVMSWLFSAFYWPSNTGRKKSGS
jgi:hypothetical protein